MKMKMLVNPSPPEVFFVTPPLKGRVLLQPPPWIFYTECLILQYLLPVYRYGPPLSIDTTMSTIGHLDDVPVTS